MPVAERDVGAAFAVVEWLMLARLPALDRGGRVLSPQHLGRACWSPGSGRSSTSASTSRARSATSAASGWARRSAASSAASSPSAPRSTCRAERDPARARRHAGLAPCRSAVPRSRRAGCTPRHAGHRLAWSALGVVDALAPAAQGAARRRRSVRSPPACSTTCSRPTSSHGVDARTCCGRWRSTTP